MIELVCRQCLSGKQFPDGTLQDDIPINLWFNLVRGNLCTKCLSKDPDIAILQREFQAEIIEEHEL